MAFGPNSRNDLAACATRSATLVVAVNYGNRFDADSPRQLPFRDGAKHRSPLRAIGQSVRGVLHIAAGDDFAFTGQQGCAHMEIGIRRIGQCRRGVGRVPQQGFSFDA